MLKFENGSLPPVTGEVLRTSWTGGKAGGINSISHFLFLCNSNSISIFNPFRLIWKISGWVCFNFTQVFSKSLIDLKANSSWFSIGFVVWKPITCFFLYCFLTWAVFWCGDVGIVLLLNNNFSLAAPAVKHEHLVGSHSKIWNGHPAKAQGFLFVLTVAMFLFLLVSRSYHLCFSDTYGQTQRNSSELTEAATEVNLSQYVCKLTSHLSWRVPLISNNSTGVVKGRYLLVSFGQLTLTLLSDKSYWLWEKLSGKSHTHRLLTVGGKQIWNAEEISTLSIPPTPTSQAIKMTSWVSAASVPGSNKSAFLTEFLLTGEKAKRRKESEGGVGECFLPKPRNSFSVTSKRILMT